MIEQIETMIANVLDDIRESQDFNRHARAGALRGLLEHLRAAESAARVVEALGGQVPS